MKKKEIIASRQQIPFYLECYQKFGYKATSVKKVCQGYSICLERNDTEEEQTSNAEMAMESRLRMIELASRKTNRFFTLFVNLSVHVALFCVQGAVLYQMKLEDAHPAAMLQVGVPLFLLLLFAWPFFKLKEVLGWNKTIRDLKRRLYDPLPSMYQGAKRDRVISVLFTRNRGPVSNLIYWCTGRQFTHSALGLGEQTENFYSFGFRGFRIEHPAHRTIRGKKKESLCYQFKVSKDEYAFVEQKVQRYLADQEQHRYNLAGAILGALHIYMPMKGAGTYFCSEFVSETLRELPSFHLRMKANMYLPTHLARALVQQDNLWQVKVNEV